MFQDNDRAARIGGIHTSPQRLKRFKSIAVGAAFAALAISQTAIAQDACPAGPTSGTTAKNWDIDKIRDFGMFMGLPEKQLMLCLHRGLHSNFEDDADPFWKNSTVGVPDNSMRAIISAFNHAPCVELDVTSRTIDSDSQDAGVSELVLAHETLGNRMISQSVMLFGSDRTIPSDCTSITPPGSDGMRRAKCPVNSPYNQSTDTYKAPTSYEKLPFRSNTADAAQVRNILWGYLRPMYNTTEAPTIDIQADFTRVLTWMKSCMDTGNIGLVVIDMKDSPSTSITYSEINRFIATLPLEKRAQFKKHLMVKSKAWKMGNPTIDPEWNTYRGLLDRYQALGIPHIDTIAQAGVVALTGATPKPGVDYIFAEKFFQNRAGQHVGTDTFRAIELVVPGTARYDPIRSGNLKLRMAADCTNINYSSKDLEQIASLANTCNLYPRTGSTKTRSPQIWGWVPLEDGRAKNLINGDGTSATPAGSTYIKSSDGRYPFGISSGAGAPIPFVVFKDDAERNDNHVTTNIGARAITIDSISKYSKMFPGYTTGQGHFMKW